VKVTLLDDTVTDIDLDTVKEVSQDMGQAFPLYNICGVHPLFGRALCPVCVAKGIEDGCGKYYVYSISYDDPSPIEIQLKDGQTLYAKDWGEVET
jgi:hypothetical protein